MPGIEEQRKEKTSGQRDDQIIQGLVALVQGFKLGVL